MLNDTNIIFNYNGIPGVPLTWVIDQECLYDLPLSEEHANIFLNADSIIDISIQYPDHNGITVRFLKNNETLEDFQTSEYFGSILLSEPQVVDLRNFPYGKYVMNNNATFDGTKFIIKGVDLESLEP